MDRNKAIEKAKKLRALADRGVDGERVNAKAQLEKIIQEHQLSDVDIDSETETHEVISGWHVQTDKRKYADEEIVLAGHTKTKMIVEEAYVTLKGWRYKLRFLKKDGTANKRTCAWFYYAKDIMKLNHKALSNDATRTD